MNPVLDTRIKKRYLCAVQKRIMTMKKIVLLALTAFIAMSASAQKPLRYIKLDPKATPTSEVRMVTSISARPLKRFPTEILTADNKAHEVKIEMLNAQSKPSRFLVNPLNVDQKTCNRDL